MNLTVIAYKESYVHWGRCGETPEHHPSKFEIHEPETEEECVDFLAQLEVDENDWEVPTILVDGRDLTDLIYDSGSMKELYERLSAKKDKAVKKLRKEQKEAAARKAKAEKEERERVVIGRKAEAKEKRRRQYEALKEEFGE